MLIVTQIKQYITQNLLFNGNEYPYDDNASFIREGIIDSMGIMELVTFVSSAFHIQVEPMEMTPDNFDSVNKLVDFIRRKQEPAEVLNRAQASPQSLSLAAASVFVEELSPSPGQ